MFRRHFALLSPYPLVWSLAALELELYVALVTSGGRKSRLDYAVRILYYSCKTTLRLPFVMFTLLVGYVLVFAVLGARGGDFLTEVIEAESQHTLVHSEAFTQQLSLVRPDASMEQFPLTEEDVQYLGIAADTREFTHLVLVRTMSTFLASVEVSPRLPTAAPAPAFTVACAAEYGRLVFGKDQSTNLPGAYLIF